uniref:Uncharacterized protein n=1 Tax=Fagus sylvatica TaxID=28930 RepID=A0A2N9F6U7_FAGSY
MEGIAPPLFQLPLAASPSSSSSSSSYSIPTLPIFSKQHHFPLSLHCHHRFRRTTRSPVVVLVGSNEETTTQEDEQLEYEEPDPQDLENVRQIKRVLELLRKNRDMIFNEVKLTIMIEDPREVERRRLLGIEDVDTPTREDLAAVLEEGWYIDEFWHDTSWEDSCLKDMFLERYRIVVDKNASFASYMDHGRSWNRQCTRSPQDWELESVQNFFELLYSNVPSGQGMDQICWRPSREGKFDCLRCFTVGKGNSILIEALKFGRRFVMWVNQGKVPKDRVALQILAEEMIQWPNLEVEVTKKKPGKSLYAKATDTGIDPKEAAKRLNWDSAAEIEASDVSDDSEVPSALGYGALYLVTAFPVIIDPMMFTTELKVDVHMAAEQHPHYLNFSTTKGGAQEAAEFYDEVEVEVDADMSHDLPYEYEFLPLEKPKILVEKQISVDPISLQGSSMGKASFKLMLPPLPPAKTNNLARQHSAAADDQLALKREMYLQRSKSCSEGRARASTDDFDLWMTKPNSFEYDKQHESSFSKTEVNIDSHKNTRSMDAVDEEFKCGALCLFLPGFGKGKPVRPKKEEVEVEHVISRTVSLEKFECGSWASSAITHDSEDDSKSLYFDLPLELIRTSVNDAHSPVTAAFIFDNDRKGVLKSGSTRSTAKKSDESPRHVRFSTSSPISYSTSPASCITPRLRKAREEFNAFLEAQGA